mmetsp:Transcript_32037/g.81493  ORF Transcript_32037/g.81493 Transcript_32037/m.81493 type:complete len:293 (+) Transcript_32037:3-881(+)
MRRTRAPNSRVLTRTVFRPLIAVSSSPGSMPARDAQLVGCTCVTTVRCGGAHWNSRPRCTSPKEAFATNSFATYSFAWQAVLLLLDTGALRFPPDTSRAKCSTCSPAPPCGSAVGGGDADCGPTCDGGCRGVGGCVGSLMGGGREWGSAAGEGLAGSSCDASLRWQPDHGLSAATSLARSARKCAPAFSALCHAKVSKVCTHSCGSCSGWSSPGLPTASSGTSSVTSEPEADVLGVAGCVSSRTSASGCMPALPRSCGNSTSGTSASIAATGRWNLAVASGHGQTGPATVAV